MGIGSAVGGRVGPASVKAALANRVGSIVHPALYHLRSRAPRYNLRQQAAEFNRLAAERGLGDTRLLYWYHTVDLGGGLITPGTLDYRPSLDRFGFPEDMHGMSVLDVGSATGFFAFEFERRGAKVVSIEVPGLDKVDRFPLEDESHTVAKMAQMMAEQMAYTSERYDEVVDGATAEAFHRCFLDGPFQLCHRALGSQVERHYASIYELPETEVGSRSFDLIFLGDLLLHTMHPFKALAAVAPLCRGKLILAQQMPTDLGPHPAIRYVGGDTFGKDHSTWWFPNQACFEQILRKLKFADVRLVGYHHGVTRPTGNYFRRPILHACR